MTNISLLLVIAGASQKELARQIRYLKVENQILRSRLRKRLDAQGAGQTGEVRREAGRQSPPATVTKFVSAAGLPSRIEPRTRLR